MKISEIRGQRIIKGYNFVNHYKNRIIAKPEIMLGKPVIKGTRITVELLLRKLSEGMTIPSLLKAYPHLSKEDIYAALSYSSDVIGSEEIMVKD